MMMRRFVMVVSAMSGWIKKASRWEAGALRGGDPLRQGKGQPQRKAPVSIRIETKIGRIMKSPIEEPSSHGMKRRATSALFSCIRLAPGSHERAQKARGSEGAPGRQGSRGRRRLRQNALLDGAGHVIESSHAGLVQGGFAKDVDQGEVGMEKQ